MHVDTCKTMTVIQAKPRGVRSVTPGRSQVKGHLARPPKFVFLATLMGILSNKLGWQPQSVTIILL